VITRTDARARAAAAHAAAELAEHPRDRAALKAAAAAWERIAGPGVAWGTKQLGKDLLQLRIDVVAYQGPFQPPQPPKAPSPAAAPLVAELKANGGPAARALARKLEEATIEF
jgi:hypothetical protein